MRDIIFKAQRVDGKGWVEGDLFNVTKIVVTTKSNEGHLTEKGSDSFKYEYIEVIPETVCQYTGLNDKNGKRIFENDIMQHTNPFDEPFIVNFDSETASFVFNNGSSGYGIYDKSFSVIGNVHDKNEE